MADSKSGAGAGADGSGAGAGAGTGAGTGRALSLAATVRVRRETVRDDRVSAQVACFVTNADGTVSGSTVASNFLPHWYPLCKFVKKEQEDSESINEIKKLYTFKRGRIPDTWKAANPEWAAIRDGKATGFYELRLAKVDVAYKDAAEPLPDVIPADGGIITDSLSMVVYGGSSGKNDTHGVISRWDEHVKTGVAAQLLGSLGTSLCDQKYVLLARVALTDTAIEAVLLEHALLSKLDYAVNQTHNGKPKTDTGRLKSFFGEALGVQTALEKWFGIVEDGSSDPTMMKEVAPDLVGVGAVVEFLSDQVSRGCELLGGFQTTAVLSRAQAKMPWKRLLEDLADCHWKLEEICNDLEDDDSTDEDPDTLTEVRRSLESFTSLLGASRFSTVWPEEG